MGRGRLLRPADLRVPNYHRIGKQHWHRHWERYRERQPPGPFARSPGYFYNIIEGLGGDATWRQTARRLARYTAPRPSPLLAGRPARLEENNTALVNCARDPKRAAHPGLTAQK